MLETRMELASFAADHERLTLEYLRDQERRNHIRPEWRFAQVDARGQVRARVVYWGLADAATPCLVDVVLGEPDAVTALLRASLAQLRVGEIDYQVTRPAGSTERGPAEPAALEAAGFALISTQQRLLYSGAPPRSAPVAGVAVRTIAEVGVDPLVTLVAAVRAATADRASALRFDAAAEVEALRRLSHEPAWWLIASADEQPLGFVLPTRTDGSPVIGDIGVAPAARGRGIGRLLLALGTAAVLGEDGRVGADVDDENVPMLTIAAAVGYRAVAARAHYRRSGLPDPT